MTTETDTTRSPAPARRRSLDPQGSRALFETPVSAARDTIRSGKPADGKDALYSTGPRQAGTVIVDCSACEARSRINLTDLAMRWVGGSIWVPGRKNSHWMRCPSCTKRTWCASAGSPSLGGPAEPDRRRFVDDAVRHPDPIVPDPVRPGGTAGRRPTRCRPPHASRCR